MRESAGLLFFDTGDLPPPQYLYHHCQHRIPQHQHPLPALVLRKRAMSSPIAAAQASHAAAACTCDARCASINQHGTGGAEQRIKNDVLTGSKRRKRWRGGEAAEAAAAARRGTEDDERMLRARQRVREQQQRLTVLCSKATATASEQPTYLVGWY